MGSEAQRLDVRGLAPCEPMERILAGLEQLPRGGSLHALLDRDPVFLYSILEQRGFQWRVLVNEEDRCELLIHRAGEDDSAQ